jgi:PAS domain-containing protein
MFDDKETELSRDSLIKENTKLKRRLRHLEIAAQRNQSMLATRIKISSMLESEQQRMERHMSLILDNSADIILLLDNNGRFSYFTDTFLKATGTAGPFLVAGKHFSEVFAGLLPESEAGLLQEK